MGLPMFVSPPLSKRQLPPKQSESDLSTDSLNSRTSAFGNRNFLHRNLSNSPLPYNNDGDSSTFPQDMEANLTYPQHTLEIPDWQPIRTEIQRSEERRRRRSLQQNIQRLHQLHQLHHLHRTREHMTSTSSGMAARRGLQAAQLMSLQAEQASHAAQIPLPALRSPVRLRNSDEHRSYHRRSNHDRSHRVTNNDGDASSLSSPVTDSPSSSSPISSTSTTLDEVIRRVNLLRHMAQQQERLLRPRYRSSNGSSRSSSSTTSGLTREELTSRIEFSPISVDNPTLVPTQNLGRLAPLLSSPSSLSSHRHHHHRHYTVALEQAPTNSSSFEADNQVNFSIVTDNPINLQQARILSPIPRRYGSTYSNALAAVSGNSADYDGEERDGYEVDPNGALPGEPPLPTTTNNDDGIRRVPIERGSASGECC